MRIFKGREEGRQEGRQEERFELARRFKQKGVDVQIIAETTGLTQEQIEKLWVVRVPEAMRTYDQSLKIYWDNYSVVQTPSTRAGSKTGAGVTGV